MENNFYAVAVHGTAGLGDSYGYAELRAGEPLPRADMTTTVSGPHTRPEAERVVAEWNALCDKYRAETTDD